MTAVIDRDALHRVEANLAERHGALTISTPNPSTGSVTITTQHGQQFRFTTQSRLIPAGLATTQRNTR